MVIHTEGAAPAIGAKGVRIRRASDMTRSIGNWRKGPLPAVERN